MFMFFPKTSNFSTGFGEQLVISLPDESKVILNAKSKLSYRESDWKKGNRKVNLQGEGYFEVTSGSDFVVHFKNGHVSVLGTAFTINTTTNNTEVLCFEGKVKADINNKSRIVSGGEAIRYIDDGFENFVIAERGPSWITYNSNSFKNSPMHTVISALENQYNLKIHRGAIDSTLRFTGSFPNNNLDIALKTVFNTMEIKFTFTDDTTIHLSNK